jgi:hypothetical protein
MSDGIRSGVNCTRKLGLGQPGHTDQQSVSTCKQSRERQVDDALLAENNPTDLRSRIGDVLERRIGVAGQLSWVGDMGHAHQLVLCAVRMASVLFCLQAR